MTERQKVIAALVASALLHLIAFIAISLWLYLQSRNHSLEDLKLVEVAVATPTPEPLQIVALASRPTPPPMLDTTDLNRTQKAPEKPVFEADENSAAASALPGLGKIPLPTQNGKERRELAFQNQKFTLGDGEGSVAQPPVMEFAPAPALPPPKVRNLITPAPRPLVTPRPTPKAKPSVEPSATPMEMAAASVTPIAQPTEGPEPLYRPTPVPSATPVPTPDITRPTPVPTARPAQSMAMLTTPAPLPQHSQAPRKPGYHPDTAQTKIVDGISNRGRAGVDAIGTPVGRYRKRIADSIGSRWYYYMDQRMDLITTGSVRINFFINNKGHVEDLKIISNEANQALANFSVQAITEAKIPPPPPELAPTLENGRYEVTYTFTIYPN